MRTMKLWKSLGTGLVAAAALLLTASGANAQVAKKVQETQARPLTELVTGKMQPLQAGAENRMYLITWGGDVGTILANEDNLLGAKFELITENDVVKTAQALIDGKTPYFRGTFGMVNAVLPAVKQAGGDLVVFHQMTWSAGGDTMVVRSEIRNPRDLKGKTIGLQFMGPHMDYLAKILSDAGLSLSDVKIVWFQELTTPKKDPGFINSPVDAFRANKNLDAVMCISPDAMVLTSGSPEKGFQVGSGADDSVKGAHVLISSKVNPTVIGDTIAVRADYFSANQDRVRTLANGLLQAQERLLDLKARAGTDQGAKAKYGNVLRLAGQLLLDSPQATADVDGMIGDAQFVGHQGNVQFFTGVGTTRNFETLTQEIQAALGGMNILRGNTPVAKVNWDWNTLATGLKNVGVVAPVPAADRQALDSKAAAKVQSRIDKNLAGYVEDDTLFFLQVGFEAKQFDFDPQQYGADFEKAMKLIDTNRGAVVVFEGYMDPAAYVRAQKEGKSQDDLNNLRQSAKNQGLKRAQALKAQFLKYCAGKGIDLTGVTYVTTGVGIDGAKFPDPGDDVEKKKANRRAVIRVTPGYTEDE